MSSLLQEYSYSSWNGCYLAKQNGSPGYPTGAKQSPFGERCQAQSREDLVMERMATGQLLITKKDIQL